MSTSLSTEMIEVINFWRHLFTSIITPSEIEWFKLDQILAFFFNVENLCYQAQMTVIYQNQYIVTMCENWRTAKIMYQEASQ